MAGLALPRPAARFLGDEALALSRVSIDEAAERHHEERGLVLLRWPLVTTCSGGA